MGEAVKLKYRAFISYSHADTKWAKWLHGRLEGFRIDKELVGRKTGTGVIGKSLRPIFRDRHDFQAGHSLTDQTLAALNQSAALVVLCSPAAARSEYVNEEIRLFKLHHPERPVVPVIIDGQPGDAEGECFAPALRFELSAEGTVSNTPASVIAADVRDNGDGRELALAKVVASIMGLPPDDVFRRAERERRRKGRVRNGVIGALAVLAIAATGSAVFAWQQLKTNEIFLIATLKRATGIVDTAVRQSERFGIPRTVTLELLRQAEGLFDDMASLGRQTPELKQQKAWMLIQMARNYEIVGDTEKQKQYVSEAVSILSSLAESRVTDLGIQRDLGTALTRLGDVRVSQGNLMAALNSYEAGLAIRKRLVESDPDNADWQRDLSWSYDEVGDVQEARGNLTAALKSYEASLAIARRLVESNPNHTRWQRELSLLYDEVGDVQLAQGNLTVALASFEAGLAIRKRHVETHSNQAGWQHLLALSYTRIGDVRWAQRGLAAALKSYEAGLAICKRLVEADPDNVLWQQDLHTIHQRLGDVMEARGDLSAALEHFEQSKKTNTRLAKSDPKHTGWQRELSVSYIKVGDVQVAQGDLTVAIRSYEAGLAIQERLAESDPNNTGWQRELAVLHTRIGDVQLAQGNLTVAQKGYEAGMAIAKRLADAHPNNAGWQRDLAVSHSDFGKLYRQSGESDRSRKAFEAGRRIIADLVKASPGHAGWKKDLAWFDSQIRQLKGH